MLPATARKQAVQQCCSCRSQQLSSPLYPHQLSAVTPHNLLECRRQTTALFLSWLDFPCSLDESHLRLFLGSDYPKYCLHPYAVSRDLLVISKDLTTFLTATRKVARIYSKSFASEKCNPQQMFELPNQSFRKLLHHVLYLLIYLLQLTTCSDLKSKYDLMRFNAIE